MSEEIAYNTSKAATGELVYSLLGGSFLNYVGHRACIRGASTGARKERKHVELAELARRKELAGGQERNRLHRVTRNGAWLNDVNYRLNDTDLSQEESWDNLCLVYGLMPQDIPATINGCGKRLSIDHAISCPKGVLVLEWHDDSAKEWSALGARALVPSAIPYKPRINNRTVQGERTGAGARQESGTVNDSADIVEESQGGSTPTVMGQLYYQVDRDRYK